MVTRARIGCGILALSLAIGAVAAGLGFSGHACATAVHRYGADEYAVVSGGVAPDGRHAIAAHGKGELGDEDFHLYLMGAPTGRGDARRRIGPLEEVVNVLDTAPDTFYAQWTTDSRHVALTYRGDRHIRALNLYRVEHGRAFAITGPMPLDAVVGEQAAQRGLDLRARSLEITWVGKDRLRIAESGTVRASRDAEPLRRLERYGALADVPQNRDDDRVFMEYSIIADCRLVSGDRYELVELKPEQPEK